MKYWQILAAACLMLTACGGDEVDLSKYDTTAPPSVEYAYQQSIGEWFTPESEYSLGTDDGNLEPGRQYFSMTSRADDKVDMWAYVSRETGELQILCPDPLCTHRLESDCKYAGIIDLLADPEKAHILYAVRQSYDDSLQYSLCRIDTEADTVEELLSEASTYERSVRYNLNFIAGNELHFTTYTNTREKIGEGEVAKVEERLWNCLDLASGEVSVIREMSDTDAVNCVMADAEHMWFVDQAGGRFYVTDRAMEHPQTVLTFEPEYSVRDTMYDADEGAFYLLVASLDLHMEQPYDIKHSTIYRVAKDLTVSELAMPTEQIVGFYMTGDFIYYTQYDPREYGKSPRGSIATDYTGGRIWRVARDSLTAPELIFDGQGEIPISNGNFTVVGDNLYIDYMHVMNEGGLQWFRRMGSTVRINFVNNTIAWLNLE